MVNDVVAPLTSQAMYRQYRESVHAVKARKRWQRQRMQALQSALCLSQFDWHLAVGGRPPEPNTTQPCRDPTAHASSYVLMPYAEYEALPIALQGVHFPDLSGRKSNATFNHCYDNQFNQSRQHIYAIKNPVQATQHRFEATTPAFAAGEARGTAPSCVSSSDCDLLSTIQHRKAAIRERRAQVGLQTAPEPLAAAQLHQVASLYEPDSSRTCHRSARGNAGGSGGSSAGAPVPPRAGTRRSVAAAIDATPSHPLRRIVGRAGTLVPLAAASVPPSPAARPSRRSAAHPCIDGHPRGGPAGRRQRQQRSSSSSEHLQQLGSRSGRRSSRGG